VIMCERFDVAREFLLTDEQTNRNSCYFPSHNAHNTQFVIVSYD